MLDIMLATGEVWSDKGPTVELCSDEGSNDHACGCPATTHLAIEDDRVILRGPLDDMAEGVKEAVAGTGPVSNWNTKIVHTVAFLSKGIIYVPGCSYILLTCNQGSRFITSKDHSLCVNRKAPSNIVQK